MGGEWLMKKCSRDTGTFILAWLYVLTFIAVPILMILKSWLFN